MNKYTNKLIISSLVLTLIVVLGDSKAYARDCGTYGGGDNCEEEVTIEKRVRIKGDNDWKRKVTGVEEDETVEFRIRIKNTGNVDLDDMKMRDILPSDMERVGGSGLTEYWNDFEDGDTKEFIIEAEIKNSEFDRENFEKCIVNRAEAYQDDDFKGSDTATVCYGNAELTELPETGSASMIASLLGLGSTVLGTILAKSKRFA